MNESKKPSIIAREALRQLVARQLPPTPANFQACYNEIAGLPDLHSFPEVPLRELAGALPAAGAAQEEWHGRLMQAIARRSWLGVREALSGFVLATRSVVPRADARTEEAATETRLPPAIVASLGRFVECIPLALGDDDETARTLLAEVRQALREESPPVSGISERLDGLADRLLFSAEEQAEIKGALLKLLHLVIENVGELAMDDRWLKGQVDGLLASIEPPLTLRRLDDMERRLRDVMDKQGRARARALEAQEEMRQMLTTFIERLATMNAASTEFQHRIEDGARRIEQVDDPADLRPLLRGIVEATTAMAEETASSREQLRSLQEHVLATEAELTQLHLELDKASELARHDPLTDVLNRKGLDEALAREIAAMRRKGSVLSLCLLDIDNFKRLNDQLGHDVGDGALKHLADVARASIRPSDTLARYGGEEFVILMPETTVQQGVEAMVRLQRELTRTLYLGGPERIVITFSAGVAQLGTDEPWGDALRRADKAMYLAKRAGKNRVLGA